MAASSRPSSYHYVVNKLFTAGIQPVAEVVGQLEPQVLAALDLTLWGWLALS
jgi:hypothetical protein